MDKDKDKTRSFLPLTNGTIVHHYKIVSRIGAGGMGEVYLAQDTRLDRKVALKFLPINLSQDEASRARFTREAKAAAKLDHPNIVPVYEVGEFQGRPFFAMAHIEGESLREVIKEGKLSISEAINITMQICEGLHKAHESGVVHRDIKPSNIIIDSENRARLLDFGLATVSGEKKLTKTGSTMGTIGYMSPELVKGEKADHRSDLFSVGVVLYEMITGRMPFEADHEAAIQYNIINENPEPLSRYKSGVTGELQQIINKALSKDPSLRYQHADDLLADLKRIEIGIPVARKKRSRIMALVATVAVAIIVLVTYYLVSHVSEYPTSPVRKRQLTFDGDVYAGAISPDGKFIAYVRGVHGGLSKPAIADSMTVYVKELDGGEPIKIFTDWLIAGVWWTPDGRQLLIRGDNAERSGFYLLPKLGGSPRYYSIGSTSLGTYWRVSWNVDGGRFVAGSDAWPKSLFVADKRTGEVAQVDVDGEFDWIVDFAWMPTLDELLLVVIDDDGARTCTVPISGGIVKEISGGVKSSPRWAPDGNSLCYVGPNGDLLRVGFDVKENRWTGEPRLLVANATQPFDQIVLDSSETMMCLVQRSQWSNLRAVIIDSSGQVQPGFEQLTTGTAQYLAPSVSPDGSSLLCTRIINGQMQVVILYLETKKVSQISHTNWNNFAGAWSRDGSRIAYATIEDGIAKLAVASAKGGTPEIYDSAVVNNIYNIHSHIAWAPNSRILYEVPGMKSLMSFDPETKTQTRVGPTDTKAGVQVIPCGSPRGDTLVLFWNRFQARKTNPDEPVSKSGVWISSFAGDYEKLLAPLSLPLTWSSDGEWIYVWRFDDRFLSRVSISEGTVDSLGYVQDAGPVGVTISLEAQRLIYVHEESTSDLWLVENIPLP